MAKSPSSPAKQRYDKRHPTISFRASSEEYARLKAVLGRQNKTIGEFFRAALVVEQRNCDEAEKRGFEKGFKEAKDKYAVSKRCIVCGKPILITSEKAKLQMAAAYRSCLRHEDCEVPFDPNASYPYPITVVRKKKKK